MTLQRISFEHFYMETVDTIEKQYAVLVNPQVMQFFKCGNVYLAVTADKTSLVLNFAINTGKKATENWVDLLVRESAKAGFDKIVFITSVNNKSVQAIARRYDCELIKTNPNYYLDGSDALVFEGNLK